MHPASQGPDWDRLYGTASAQDGLFTTQQAAEAGYSPPLLAHHVRAGRILHLRRGLYRLVHFPAGEHEECVVAWLWSNHEGTLSHETALAFHDLSDVLPDIIHLTVPEAWRTKRLRVPRGIALHYGDVTRAERAWFGPVPATAPRRTLVDCARAGLSPELMEQATRQAIRRGLLAKADLAEVKRELEPHRGTAP